jgi:putative oxidoreductase
MNATTLTSNTTKAAAISATRLDYAALLLRASLGTMFLAHGLMKFVEFTLPGTAAFFESVGFPGWTAYIVAPAEVLAGIALIAGFRTRLVALLSLPILLGAIVPHVGAGWSFSNAGGGWEYPVYLVATAVVVALLGGGRLALTRPHA